MTGSLKIAILLELLIALATTGMLAERIARCGFDTASLIMGAFVLSWGAVSTASRQARFFEATAEGDEN